jgi:hypothetical protein
MNEMAEWHIDIVGGARRADGASMQGFLEAGAPTQPGRSNIR